MAFLVKTAQQRSGGPSNSGSAVIDQFIQVSRAAKALPQTATEQLFRIHGGRVLVKLLVGEVTTAIQSTDPVAKVSISKLSAAGALVGTAYDIASTLDMSSDEVGTMYGVEGDGTAITSGGQVAGSLEAFGTGFIAAGPGQIYLTTGASKTGAIKWDLWYQPLDPGAYVVAVDTATAAIT
jgi:hypothetical protein